MTEPDTGLPAALRLSVAIDQLIQPGHALLDRSQPESTPEVAATTAQAEKNHHDRMQVLRARHTAARRDRDHAQMRRTLQALIALERAHQAAVDARGVTTARLPSLLEQLQDAVESSQGTGTGSAGHTRSPIGLQAAELLGHIQRAIGHRRHQALADQLHTWAGHPDRTDQDAELAEQWVTDTRAVVAPDRGFELGGACPLCGRRRVWVQDGDERILKAALQVSYATRSARCIAPGCTGRWPREYLDHLARVVVQDCNEKAG